MSANLPTLYQQFIHLSRYARWIDQANRRETWEETVDRYIDFMCHKCGVKGRVRTELREAILNLEVMPSMRCMMTAGHALERDEIAAYNCSFTAIDHISTFDEMLYILMCGSGVGFSVERQFIANMPVVAPKLRDSKTIIRVEDSKLGWANAFREMISMLYQGRIPEWDVSEVRPSGTRLKTFGGRASGPEPLEDLFRFSVSMFKEAAGRRLTSIECHDLCCKIGEVVVVGGVRRSALISLSNPSDDRMRHAKSGNWYEVTPWRRLANNSACYTEKPGMDIFMREWLALYDSKSGERGIFNRTAARNQVKRFGRRDPDHEWGCNPSLRRGTRLLTDSGIRTIDELDGKEFGTPNLSGEMCRARCFLSGKDKPLYRITLVGGHEYYATKEHKWPVLWSNEIRKFTTEQLRDGDRIPIVRRDSLPDGNKGDVDSGFLIGWTLGDGWITQRSDSGFQQVGMMVSSEDRANNIDTKLTSILSELGSDAQFGDTGELNTCNSKMDELFEYMGMRGKEYGLPSTVWTASEAFRKGLIDGLFSADGCFCDGVSLTTAHECLARNVAELLGFYGIKTCVKSATVDGVFPNGKDYGKKYIRWDVKVRHSLSIRHFGSIFRLSHSRKQKQLDLLCSSVKKSNGDDYVRVKSVELTDMREDVWDVAVYDDDHCFPLGHCMTGNCSEIIIRPNGLCNLTEVVVRSGDTVRTLMRKVRLATILGTMQATLTEFRYLRPVWKQNAEEERLLGVSLTGVMDHELLSGAKGNGDLAETLQKLRAHAVKTNKDWARKLGIAQAAAVTCNKPSGTVSQLADCSSGIHARKSPYYIRNVRADKKDPLAQMMVRSGFPHEDDVAKPEHNWVFPFPIKAPDGVVTEDNRTALEQLKTWKTYQDHWCEHKPSCTVTVREPEWMSVGAWVYEHFDQISGISFLPATGHVYKQAPYEPCAKKEYDAAVKKLPEIVDWSGLAEFEKGDSSVNYGELACSAGSCEMVDLVKE